MKKIKRLDGKKTPSQTFMENNQFEGTKDLHDKKVKPYSDSWGLGFKDEKQERKYMYGVLLVLCLIWGPPFLLASLDEELFLRYSPLMKGVLLSIGIMVVGSILIHRLLNNYKAKKWIMFLFCIIMLIRMIIQLANEGFLFMETM